MDKSGTPSATSLAFDQLTRLRSTLEAARGANEATTRLRAIDSVLFEVLAWEKASVEAEKYCRATGFADYVLSCGGSKSLVVEAKRDGATFLLPGRVYTDDAVGFALLASECAEAAAALRQASGYAASLGARYVAITNGHQWILALTHVDGEAIDERSVLVWESLDSIQKRFSGFFAALSPSAIGQNEPSDKLFEPRRQPAPTKLSALVPNYPVPANRNVIANELGAVIGVVWNGVSHAETSASFLRDCYVVPRDSLEELRLAAELLAEHMQRDSLVSPTAAISSPDAMRVMGEPGKERPILVLGRVGHGKTTFLRYLRLVSANEVLKGYCQLEVDFLDRPDTPDKVPEFIYSTLEDQLLQRFGIDITEDKTVRGILDSEIIRFRKSPRGVAFSSGTHDYKLAEIAFIENITSDKPRFMRHVIHHLQRGQGKSVAVFFDNLDRRSDAIQEEAFLRSSAIAREWNCVVFVCLRPSTFHRSRRDGVLDSIAPKVISVSAPDPAILLKKRFEFAIKVASGQDVGVDLQTGKRAGGVEFDLKTAAEFLECCRDSFWRNRDLVALLEAASNGNTRDLLMLVMEILGSNHLNTRKILEHIRSQAGYRIPQHEIVRCLLYKDDMHYSPTRSWFLNVFDIQHSDKREHFGRLLMLSLLQRAGSGADTFGYVSIDDVVSYMGQHGYSAAYSRRTARLLYDGQSLEGRVAGADWGDVTDLRTTSHGRYLVNHLVRTFNYVDAVIVDTPIIDEGVRSRVRDVASIQERVERAVLFVDYLAACASVLQDRVARNMWDQTESGIRSSIAEVRANLEKR